MPTGVDVLQAIDRQDPRLVTDELESALRMATMAIPAEGRSTLRAPGDGPFLEWLEGVFRKVLAPHADRVAGFARKGFVGEIGEADRQLSEALDLPEAVLRCSVARGAAILESRSGLRSCPVVSRIAQAVEAGTLPGHHATVFAAQAAVFHLSAQGVLVGLAFDEWRRANQASGVAGFRHLLPEVTGAASAVFIGLAGQRFQIA